jgi:hypothetical protein
VIFKREREDWHQQINGADVGTFVKIKIIENNTKQNLTETTIAFGYSYNVNDCFLFWIFKRSGYTKIIDQAITVSGTEMLRNAEASFTFREKDFNYRRFKGQFVHTRVVTDMNQNRVRGTLTNKGLTDCINNSLVGPTEKRRNMHSNSVNSVIYFAFLPFWLNDRAAVNTYAGYYINKK